MWSNNSSRSSSRGSSVATPTHAREDFPHFGMKKLIVDFVPCIPRTLRVVRALSSQWRAASERASVWSMDRKSESFSSKSGSKVLLRLHSADADGSSGVSTLLNPTDDTTTVLQAKLNRSLSCFNEIGLLKAFQIMDWIRQSRPRCLLLFDLDLVDFPTSFSDPDTISSSFPSSLQRVAFGKNVRLLPEHIRTIAIGSTLLTTLRIDDWCVDDMLISLVSNCPMLTSIILRRAKLTDQSLIVMSQRSKVLKELFISECDTIGDPGVSSVARGCVSLERLSLPFCMNVSDISVREVALDLATQLVHLDLSGCLKLTSDSLLPLLEDQIKLQSLNLSFCPVLITTEVLEAMVRTCWCLRSATFAFANVVPDEEGPLRRHTMGLLKEMIMRGCDVLY
jgi:hypothetical protein